MKRARFTEEQIIGILREHEAGAKTASIPHPLGFAVSRKPVARAGAYLFDNHRFLTIPPAREIFSHSLAPGVGSANSMTPWSNRACSMRPSLGAPVGRRSCLRSQNLTARSSTPSAAPSVRCVSPAKTRAARSWRPVTRFLLCSATRAPVDFVTLHSQLLRLRSRSE